MTMRRNVISMRRDGNRLHSWNRLGCRDMGIACSFVAAAKTPERVKKLLFDHALRRHGELMKNSAAKMVEEMDRLLS